VSVQSNPPPKRCERLYFFFSTKLETRVAPKEGYDIDIVATVTKPPEPAKVLVKPPVFYGGGELQPINPTARPKPVRVVLAPGTRAGSVLAIIMTRRAFRRYVYPAITELQAEYFEALSAGHRGHARWIAIRGHLLLVPGWLYGLVAQAIRRIFST
jgi:hypothetical protein